MTESAPSTPYQDIGEFLDRVDAVLLRDFLLRTWIPFETGLIGYGAFLGIHYSCIRRFGERAGTLVRPALDNLVKQGMIVTGPRADS